MSLINQTSHFVSTNPVTGEVVWEGAVTDALQVDAAIARSIQAFAVWSRRPFAERAAIAERFAALVLEQQEHFARLIAAETGKSLWDARGEVATTAGKVALSIQAWQQRTGKQQNTTAAGVVGFRHLAHGVMAVIGPFNFPAHLPNGHIVPALLAGNTVVFKPSEQTPAVAALMADLWAQAGLPEGVFQVVQGDGSTGRALVEHTGIAGVLFTGGERAGLAIHRALAGRPQVMLALEMGGNNPLVVWDVDDLAATASLIAFSAFVSAGQRCTCARRLIIPAGAAGDAILQALYEQVARLTVADPLADPAPFMGSLISVQAAAQFRSGRDELLALGAKPLWQAFEREQGAFVYPAILDMTGLAVPDEELFGPLLQVIRVDDFAQAIEVANQTRFGLAAALLSSREALFEPFCTQVRAGIINFNKPTAGASGAAPFGGVGLSGNHRPSAFYAADYCAYPVASMSGVLAPIALPGASS